MNSPLPLADSFPAFTEDDWRSAVAKIRRRGGEQAVDSAAVGPEMNALFSRRAGVRAIHGRTDGEPWQIIQPLHSLDAATIAAAIGEDVTSGATGAEIAFAGGLHPLGGQLPVEAARAVAASLAAIIPDGFELRVDTGDSAAVAEAFLDLAAACGADLVLTFDPIAALAVRGRLSASQADLGTTMQAFAERGVVGAAVIADGRLWHAGGATEEQELGATLATFVAHLRLLPEPERIGVALAADADQFRSIAKFRAMRLLLARVSEVAGLASPPPRIHGETAWRMMSHRDPEMNILRATSAAFAAAVGGADSIAVLPFDAIGGGGDDGHARRLARNTQTILAEEAHLFRVTDPAAGSGAIEALTATFAEAAWKRFQTIEAEGGIVAAITGGSLLQEVAEVREARIARVSARDLTMVGVNAYVPDEAEPPAIRTKRAPVSRTEPLRFRRLSEPFEDGAG